MDFVSKSFDFKAGERCVVIGEIGVNHNRDRDILFKLIDEGIEAGIDVVKLQRFSSKDELAETAPSTDYQRKAGQGESQLEMAQKLELPDEWLVQAYDYCKEKEVGFLCAGFDHDSVDFIADKLGCRSIKSPSPEINNKPLLEQMARKFDGLLLSSGASYLHECAEALEWVYAQADCDVAFMHCLSEYPAPLDQINLRAMKTMEQSLGVPVGYSDHTDGIIASTVAAGLGAAMIEKHYTLDKDMPGPDHKASSDIRELKALVESVRGASASLGDGIKKPVPSEAANRPLIRKTLTVNSSSLKAGTIIEPGMIAVKRPAVTGAVQPCDLEKIVGMRLLKDKSFDEAFLWSDFKG